MISVTSLHCHLGTPQPLPHVSGQVYTFGLESFPETENALFFLSRSVYFFHFYPLMEPCEVVATEQVFFFARGS